MSTRVSKGMDAMTLFDSVNFDDFSFLDRYNWLNREYMRLVHKNAELLALQQHERAGSREARGAQPDGRARRRRKRRTSSASEGP